MEGEYITISFTEGKKYSSKKINNILNVLISTFELKLLTYNFLNINVSDISYNHIFNGDYESFSLDKSLEVNDNLDKKMLDKLTAFSSKLNEKLSLNIFLNEDNTISYMCNLEKESVFKTDDSYEKFKKLALELFDNIRPLYGMIGVESEVFSLSEVSSKKFSLPLDHAYYSNKLIEALEFEHFASHMHTINLNDGVFFYWFSLNKVPSIDPLQKDFENFIYKNQSRITQ